MFESLAVFIRGLRRDLRSRELAQLLLALTLSITALSSVGFLADRLQRSFQSDAKQLLAADLLLVADEPLPQRFIEYAHSHNLQLAQTVVFPSMASAQSVTKLASLKAVSANYPLRGNLKVSPSDQSDVSVQEKGMPKSGVVWLEPGMLAGLHSRVGDFIQLGNRQFEIGGILLQETDRGAGFMNFSPRIMMSLEDLPSTGLLGFGSRVTYRLLLAGSDDSIAAYQKWAADDIASAHLHGVRIETLENAQPTMRKTLDRAQRFLSLVALLTAIVASVAIALAARRYALKQTDVCAINKCFGATQSIIFMQQCKTLAGIALIASFFGVVCADLTQIILLHFLGGLLPSPLPASSLLPAISSICLACLLLLGFAGPPLYGLAKVSPIRLVRSDVNSIGNAQLWLALGCFSSCAFVILLVADDWRLAAWVATSFGASLLLFSMLAYGALRLLAHLKTSYFVVRFALTMHIRRPAFAVIQITALGLALMALLMVLLLRHDLIPSWQSAIPPNAPNRFMINIMEDQKIAIAQLLEDAGLDRPAFYPMVRGRLTEVNGQPITADTYQDENARRLVDREFNLSYTDQLPQGNRITSGHWIEGDAPQISMEAGIAKTLHLKIGDQLSFEVAGERVEAPITSLRKLDWSSMRVNFFVIMPPAQLRDMPQSWITSYYQSPQHESLDFDLTQAYPNLTVVDVQNTLQQLQSVLDQLSNALGFLFAFTIAAAVLVLISAIAATQDERYRSAAILKALGASRQALAKIALIELLAIGSIAGLLAGLFSGMAAWALGRYVLEIEFNAFAQSLMMGLVFGITVCLLAGLRFMQRIQSASAIECLREAQT